MKKTYPAKYYLIGFVIFGLSLLLGANFWLYFQGANIQQQVHQKAKVEAQKELFAATEHAFRQLDQELKKLSQWDEVHQQLNQPSYYFYWREQRLKQSEYYKSYYQQLDLYDEKGVKLAHLPETESRITLPEQLQRPTRYFWIQSPSQDFYLAAQPIYSRSDPKQLIGYVSLAVDFYQLLNHYNQFYYLDFKELHFNRSGQIQLHQLQDALEYRAISNPVSDKLWALIEDFVLSFTLISLLAAFSVFLFVKVIFLSPLKKLTHYLQQLKENPHQSITQFEGPFLLAECQNLRSKLTNYHQALLQAQVQLNHQNHQLWQVSRTDPLTEVGNRRAFDENWQNILDKQAENPSNLAYLIFDCDHFKALNDSYGHQTGDALIKAAAKTLSHSLPESDPVYRIGGDEFALLIQDKTVEQVKHLAEKCLHDLNGYPYEQLDIKEKVTFSLGISYVNAGQPLENIRLLPRQADIAMYKAKHSPHSKIHFYQHDKDTKTQALVSSNLLNQVLASAYTGQGIQLYYQPIQAIEKPYTVYYETLVRLENKGQLIYPNDIFTVIAHHRLEVEFDQQILKHLKTQLTQNKIAAGIGFSVNISAKTLLQPFLVDLFEPFLADLKQHKIVIEITEDVLIKHINEVSYSLNKLRRQGFLIALDDFGSGYSSIRYLANMPVDIIKFDMSLTHALNTDENTKHIITSTAKMIRETGYRLVMEGIETQEQMDLAREAGATDLQGYLLGKPAPQPKEPGLLL